MKVCVIGGTNPATNPKWLDFAEDLGKRMCDAHFEMVWGGNAFGVLSHIHKKYVKYDKPNTLVMPDTYKDDLKVMKTDKVVATELVVERTHEMFLLANHGAILCVPGGIGTIYEFWTAIEGLRAGEYDFDIIMLNYKGFFDDQLKFFDFINQEGFTKIGKGGAPYKIEPTDLFKVVTTPEEVLVELEKIRDKRDVKKFCKKTPHDK
ncbi:MAG: LOG family protein [Firmicutes bacterium]|nr:LOG family protein [Bacillota bacterium]